MLESEIGIEQVIEDGGDGGEEPARFEWVQQRKLSAVREGLPGVAAHALRMSGGLGIVKEKPATAFIRVHPRFHPHSAAERGNMPAVKAKAAIFDLDGTLANTFQLVFDAFNEAMRAPLGRNYTPQEIIARFGIPDAAMIRRELPREKWAEAVDVYHAFYERAHDMVKPFPGVPEMLMELRRRKTPMAIVTGKGRRTMQTTLRLMKWHRLFRVAICGEDVAKQKPAPDGALAASSKLSVEPKECAFIGDSPADVRAAKAAGMISVAACWHPVYLSDIKRLEPDVCAFAPAEVLKLFD